MLSFMAKGFFASSPVLLLPVVALVLFIVVFAAVCWRTLRTSKAELGEVAGLPLEGGDHG